MYVCTSLYDFWFVRPFVRLSACVCSILIYIYILYTYIYIYTLIQYIMKTCWSNALKKWAVPKTKTKSPKARDEQAEVCHNDWKIWKVVGSLHLLGKNVQTQKLKRFSGQWAGKVVKTRNKEFKSQTRTIFVQLFEVLEQSLGVCFLFFVHISAKTQSKRGERRKVKERYLYFYGMAFLSCLTFPDCLRQVETPLYHAVCLPGRLVVCLSSCVVWLSI